MKLLEELINSINSFEGSSFEIAIYDPWLSKSDFDYFSDTEIVTNPKVNYYDVLIIAVSHREFKKMGSIPDFINKIVGGNGNEGFRLSDGLSGLMNSFTKNGSMDLDKLEDLAGKVASHAGSKDQLKKLARHAAKIKKKGAGREEFTSKMDFKPSASNDVTMYAPF